MIVKLLTEAKFKGGCRGSFESTLFKLLEILFRGSVSDNKPCLSDTPVPAAY